MTFPVEASRALQLRLFHSLGNHQYALTLELQSGDNVQDRVLEVFQQRKLPGCLYRSTLEYVVLAVRESLSDVEQPVPFAHSLLRDSPADSEQPTGSLHFAPPSRSKGHPRPPAGYDVRLDASLLELEELRWPRLLAAGAAGLPSPTEEMTFWCAYDFLLRHRPTFFRTIGTLEDTYLMENRELQAGRLTSISQLQMRQSIEMENVRQQAEKIRVDDEEGVSRDVQSLVAQHVGELDAVELHWQTEIDMLKVKQKASYRDLIVDFFEQEIEQIRQAHDTGGGEHSATDAAAMENALLDGMTEDIDTQGMGGGLAQPLRSEPIQSLPPAMGSSPAYAPVTSAPVQEQMGAQDDAKPGDSKLQEVAEVRAVFGQQHVFFVLRLWVGDIMDLLQAPSPVSFEDNSAEFVALQRDSDGLGSQLPRDFVGLGSYGNRYFARGSALPVEGAGWSLIQHGMTAGLPVMRNSGVGAASLKSKGGTFRSASLGFWAAPSLPRPVQLSPNAYAAHLRGLVIPTPENLQFEPMQAVMLREFSGRCNQFTDLHFAPLSDQLQLVKAATGDAPLKSGDYFCTRHSNLGGAVQVAFHLLTGSSEASASDEIPASVHRALQRVISDCQGAHVTELSLPLLLLDIGTSESSLPYAVAQRRSENALRALKGALTRLADELAPSELPELSVLNLVLPPSCAQSISARVPSVVQATLTFLRHSFQCV